MLALPVTLIENYPSPTIVIAIQFFRPGHLMTNISILLEQKLSGSEAIAAFAIILKDTLYLSILNQLLRHL